VSVLLSILTAILQAILPFLFRATERKAEDGAKQTELRDRLRGRVHRTWGKAALVLCLGLSLIVSGCGLRTVYVSDGEPVRLRATIHNAQVWVLDAAGKPVAGRMDLPEGWYCLPVPPDPEKEADGENDGNPGR